MFVGLDVAIGLVLVFSLVSLMCSAVQEWIAVWLNLRGRLLWRGIERLLGTTLADQVCKNQLVASLARKNGGRPSYLGADTFVVALLDSLGGSGGNSPITAGSVRSLVLELPEQAKERAALLALVDAANNDIERVKSNIAQWYDAAMDRVSGWYKRRAQVMLFVIAIVVVPAVGVDTVKIAQALYSNPRLLASVVESAKAVGAASNRNDQGSRSAHQGAAAEPARDGRIPSTIDVPSSKPEQPSPVTEGATGTVKPLPPNDKMLSTAAEGATATATGKKWTAQVEDDHAVRQTLEKLDQQKERFIKASEDLEGLQVPTASFNDCTVDAEPHVPRTPKTFFCWLSTHAFGFLLTAIAALLGAPFWFDVLNRFVNLRASGNKPSQASP